MAAILQNLQSTFQMKGLKTISQFLGLWPMTTTYVIDLNQMSNAQQILEKACKKDCISTLTPLSLKVHLGQ